VRSKNKKKVKFDIEMFEIEKIEEFSTYLKIFQKIKKIN
jgi:hypothetical protein